MKRKELKAVYEMGSIKQPNQEMVISQSNYTGNPSVILNFRVNGEYIGCFSFNELYNYLKERSKTK